jgi:hypothetical protein
MIPKNQQVLRGVTWRLRKQLPINCSIDTVGVTKACIQWAFLDFISGNIAEAVMGAYQGYRGWQCSRFKKLGLYLNPDACLFYLCSEDTVLSCDFE